MPTLQTPVQLTADHLLGAIKRLPPAELRKFTREFAAWQAPDGRAEEETALLADIAENSRLPAEAHARYWRLRRKSERRALNEHELAEYLSLIRQLEARNVKRIEALAKLAERRGTTVRGLMAELGWTDYE